MNTATEHTSVSAKEAYSSLQHAAILDLPWNDHQRWALCDKVGRYIIQVVADKSRNDVTTNTNNKSNRQVYILWRNLVHDTPELQGYPLQFLSERLRDEIMLTLDESSATVSSSVLLPPLSPLLLEQSWETTTPSAATILPYLDQFRFEPNGGISGLVYGVSGVADGSRLQTAPVGHVELTLPQNYVCTTDGSILYELGQPAAANNNDDEPLLLAMNEISTIGSSKHWQPDGKELAASMVAMRRSSRSTDSSSSTIQPGNAILDPELINLAALTAVVLVGAAAVQTLSHHLTVNIFCLE
jgi:hypothetical protein